MTCQHYQQQSSALLDGELVSARSVDLFAHLAGCESCRTFLADLTALNRRVQAGLRAETFSPPLEARPFRFEQSLARPVWLRHVSVRLPIAAAVALATIALVFWSLTSHVTQAPPQRVYVSTLPVVEVTAQ
jgi:predicted anti-sigma-YlaC factor YlaD